MTPSTWQEWVAWAGLALPLATLAWAAVSYVTTRRDENKQQQFARIFQVTEFLGHSGGSIASKMAAAYELRKFKEHAPMIVRLCEQVQIEGSAADMLRSELSLTAEEMRNHV